MTIHFKDNVVEQLGFFDTLIQKDQEVESLTFCTVHEENEEGLVKEKFSIQFDLVLTTQGKRLQVKFLSNFATDEDIKEGAPFLWCNAPAIAYPYLRCFVSNFLLQSGYTSIVLPTINFSSEATKEGCRLENLKV